MNGKVLAMIRFSAAFAVAGALLTSPAAAQDWPKKPVRLIVPVSAGGGVDRMARILTDRLSQQLPQRVIVENVGGAGGLIAERTVAKAAPDGHTLLFAAPSHASLPFIQKDPGYDVRGDFASVSLVTRFPLVMVINPNLPAKNTAEFIAMVKAEPGNTPSARVELAAPRIFRWKHSNSRPAST